MVSLLGRELFLKRGRRRQGQILRCHGLGLTGFAIAPTVRSGDAARGQAIERLLKHMEVFAKPRPHVRRVQPGDQHILEGRRRATKMPGVAVTFRCGR